MFEVEPMKFLGSCCSVGWMGLWWLPTLPSGIYAGKACLEVGTLGSALLHAARP